MLLLFLMCSVFLLKQSIRICWMFALDHRVVPKACLLAACRISNQLSNGQRCSSLQKEVNLSPGPPPIRAEIAQTREHVNPFLLLKGWFIGCLQTATSWGLAKTHASSKAQEHGSTHHRASQACGEVHLSSPGLPWFHLLIYSHHLFIHHPFIHVIHLLTIRLFTLHLFTMHLFTPCIHSHHAFVLSLHPLHKPVSGAEYLVLFCLPTPLSIQLSRAKLEW